jgi:hypothetical protein
MSKPNIRIFTYPTERGMRWHYEIRHRGIYICQESGKGYAAEPNARAAAGKVIKRFGQEPRP